MKGGHLNHLPLPFSLLQKGLWVLVLCHPWDQTSKCNLRSSSQGSLGHLHCNTGMLPCRICCWDEGAQSVPPFQQCPCQHNSLKKNSKEWGKRGGRKQLHIYYCQFSTPSINSLFGIQQKTIREKLHIL